MLCFFHITFNFINILELLKYLKSQILKKFIVKFYELLNTLSLLEAGTFD